MFDKRCGSITKHQWNYWCIGTFLAETWSDFARFLERQSIEQILNEHIYKYEKALPMGVNKIYKQQKFFNWNGMTFWPAFCSTYGRNLWENDWNNEEILALTLITLLAAVEKYWWAFHYGRLIRPTRFRKNNTKSFAEA